MDEFGVLTERFGLKPQGRGAPMAASKLPTNVNAAQTRNFGLHAKSAFFSPSRSLSFHGKTKTDNYRMLDDYRGLFGGIDEPKKYVGNSKSGGSSFDLDSIFTGSSNSGSNSTSFLGLDDDVFGKMPGSTSSVSAKMDDLFGSLSSASNQGAPINDFLDDLRKNETRFQNPKRNELKSAAKNTFDFDELIPGFGGSNAPSSSDRKSLKSSTLASKAVFVSAEDPFVILESTSTSTRTSSEMFSDPLEQINNYSGTKPSVSASFSALKVPPIPKPSAVADKGSNFSIIDELEHFAMGRMKNNSHEEKVKTSTSNSSKYSGATDPFGDSKQSLADDLDFLFDSGFRSRSVPKSRATNLDPLFDVHVNNRRPEVPKRTSSVSSTSIKKSSSATDIGDDFSSIFGASPVFGDLQEVDGEPEERRKARLGRHQRTLARAAKAVEDMNRRDFENLQEQEEKRRIAESLDVQIKRWAAGKEGNMRALLSTLHQVLWSECDWQPVSLTDMITSASVKKVYRKATLCIHPDKVQQKGASIEQKYTAEKVFDVLKEAWNKFSKEELS